MDINFYDQGSFLCLDGPAKIAGKKPSKVKVCFVANNQDILRKTLSDLTKDQDCYWVKYSKSSKDGMFLGRCFFISAEKAGVVWAKFKSHPNLMVTIQDDDFASQFRK